MAAVSQIAHRVAEGEFAHTLPDIIEPTWWTGTAAVDPVSFTIDCSGYEMSETDRSDDGELAIRMRETFERVGLVHLTNTGMTELSAMRKFAKVVVETEMTYDGGSNPRDNIEPNVYEVGAPLTAWLHYHHEMAYIGKSTRMVAFLAKDALPGRGATFVSDSVAVTDELLTTEFGRKLAELGVCYHRNLTDRDAFAGRVEEGVYNHWQKSLDTNDPDEAVARAEARGLVTEWGSDRLLRTRYYVSAFEYFPQLDRNLLYCSVADHGMWFDTWPLVQHLPHHDRPLHLTYGDDSEMSPDELRQFVDIYGRHGTPIDWRRGDVAVVCNYRFAHGRPGIDLEADEARRLGVILGAQYDRLGALADKW